MSDWIFQGWDQMLRVIVVGLPGSVATVGILCSSGKRTLAKLTACDLNVALVEGVAAIAMLVVCPYRVARASVRWPPVARLVRSEPQLLIRDGHICAAALHRARVSVADTRAAPRPGGLADPAEVAAAILESDGSFSVIPGARRARSRSQVPGRCASARRSLPRPSP